MGKTVILDYVHRLNYNLTASSKLDFAFLFRFANRWGYFPPPSLLPEDGRIIHLSKRNF
jgi:hypothetical protein